MYQLRPILRRGLFQTKHIRRLATASDNAQQQQQPPASNNLVRLVEVGPRDGLQNEKKSISLATKLELIERLAKSGLQDIEAGSFVSPKWVPQMADSDAILSHLLSKPPASRSPIRYSFLAPNLKGFENAISVLDKHPNPSLFSDNLPVEISVFAAATESFSEKNLNCSIATSLEKFKPVIQGAKERGFNVRAYISVVLGCPFEGYDVDPRRVAEIATDLLEMGADEIALGDTTGMGTAPRTSDLLRAMQAAGVRSEDIAMHFHDTYGQALVNTAISLEHGIRSFDSSIGGLGGCPYSPGATGNVSTEDMVYFLESLGMDCGDVDLNSLVDTGSWITGHIGKPNSSSVGKALLGRRQQV
ncbi:3-hydroxy-3-isohexenylglutaryl-CoA/hydroxy-methylglutaryl-CoA lyase [Phlyctema vagabunda]|uniref:hydroxymethylglutaryl-CoA lyase n=1 Tax=Phlyctema vagabunda TaxID=108571 RepID=A0ABR4PQ43_9HELO